MKSGIVVLKKEEGITSQGAVNRVKRLFGSSKAGHTGTLDPLATGVLPVLIGRAVKASEYMLASDKYYRATLKLGLTTDTEDITGEVLTECKDIPAEEQVLRAIRKFVGKIIPAEERGEFPRQRVLGFFECAKQFRKNAHTRSLI